eukprot:9487941-Pyramimonas_sp.AAC.1
MSTVSWPFQEGLAFGRSSPGRLPQNPQGAESPFQRFRRPQLQEPQEWSRRRRDESSRFETRALGPVTSRMPRSPLCTPHRISGATSTASSAGAAP